MIEIISAHLEEIQDNSKALEKALLKKILDNDDYSHRKLNNQCDTLIQSLECLKTIIINIKSKNMQEWTGIRQP
jgi:hypothetical protein